jgi:hypothetical protein
MPKQSGLGWDTFNVDDATGTPQDLVNDTTNFQFSTPKATQDTTGLDKSAMERILLLADFSATANGVYNPTANHSHDVFKTVPSTSVPRTLGFGIGGVSMTNECLITDYPLTRADSGEFTWAVPFSLSDGTVPTWS